MIKKQILNKIFIFSLIFTLLSIGLYSQQKNIEAAKFKRAQLLVKQLGASSFKDRKKAILELIKLGYYARAAVQTVLNSKDPEIKVNANSVWKKIRWSITRKNPELVNNFISNLEKKKATADDWHNVVSESGTDSLDILLEIQKAGFDLGISEIEEGDLDQPEPDAFGDDPFGDDPFNDNAAGTLSYNSMFKTILQLVDGQNLANAILQYGDRRKQKTINLIRVNLLQSTQFTQKSLLFLANKITSPEKLWKLYVNADFSSKMIRKSLSNNVVDYLEKKYESFKADDYYKAMLVLLDHEKLNTKTLGKKATRYSLSEAKSYTAIVFFQQTESLLTKHVKTKILQKGKEPWFKYQLMKLSGLPSNEKLVKSFRDTFKKDDDIIGFIDQNIRMNEKAAIPFYSLASELGAEDNSWLLFSTSSILTHHYQSIGNFDQAQKYLIILNKEQSRTDDTNSIFYGKQQQLIKADTVKLLVQVNEVKEAQPQKALELLNKALKLNPDILTIHIQKAQLELKTGKVNQASLSLKTAIKDIPRNLLEIRDLLHLCWDLDDKESSTQLLSKLSLSEESYGNLTLVAQTHELFLKFNLAEKLQEKIGLSSFGLARKMFYKKQYSEMLPLCKVPEEGDFQFLWGIMAARVSKGVTEAEKFSQGYVFEDNWAEIIGMTLAGKLSPQQLIDEADSTLSLSEKRGRLTEAYFYAAICFMEKGKEDFAKVNSYLEKAQKLKFRDYYEFVSAAVLSKLINQKEAPKK